MSSLQHRTLCDSAQETDLDLNSSLCWKHSNTLKTILRSWKSQCKCSHIWWDAEQALAHTLTDSHGSHQAGLDLGNIIYANNITLLSAVEENVSFEKYS